MNQRSADFVELRAAVDLLGLPVRPYCIDEFIETLVARTTAGRRTSVCYLNAHTFNLARRDTAMRHALTSTDLLYADGQSIVWAARMLGRRLPERMTSADYFARFARRCAEAGLSVYMLGGAAGVAQRAADALRSEHPGLRVAGTHHGYFCEQASESIIEAINAGGADVLTIGLGSPRQELWLAKHAARLRPPLLWCVGAQFDYLSGCERRAPAWLRERGCEWAYRLWRDPLRKWRRYVPGNAAFVLHVLREMVRTRRGGIECARTG